MLFIFILFINYTTVDRRNYLSHSTSNRSKSQMLVENHDFCLPHQHSTPPISAGILPCRLVRENYWLSDDEKILKIRLFVSTEFTNVIDRQTGTHTHRRTPHDDIGRACVASRGKTSCWTQWTDSMFSLVFSIHRALCPASLSCLLHWACGRLWHRFLLRDCEVSRVRVMLLMSVAYNFFCLLLGLLFCCLPIYR